MNQALAAGLFSLGLSVLASGCTTSKAITADEPRPEPAPRNLPSAAPEETPTPSGPLPLGAACKAEDRQHCGTKGRIAVMTVMRNGPPMKRETPCALEPLQKELDQGKGCVKDDRVYLTRDCLECRMFSSWEMTGVVAEMSDAQLVEAQQRMGLGTEPVLRTPEKWRTAIAAAAAKGARKR